MDSEVEQTPTVATLTQAFEVPDVRERLARVQSEVLPVLREMLMQTTEDAKEIYGDAFLDLFGYAPQPAPRDAAKTTMSVEFAAASWAAKRLRQRPYRVYTNAGKRAMILDVRVGILVYPGELRAQLSIWRGPEVNLFGELWNKHREECLALLEAGAPTVWSDVRVPGPPETSLATRIDRILQSSPDKLWISSPVASETVDLASAADAARWGLVCLLPIAISLVELALNRHPSLCALHRQLCDVFNTDESGDEDAPAHISSALRWSVFDRDGFRCVACGRSRAMGALLEVDHIVPQSRGGRHKLENLQTLCDRCNRGKGAKLSPDLRTIR